MKKVKTLYTEIVGFYAERIKPVGCPLFIDGRLWSDFASKLRAFVRELCRPISFKDVKFDSSIGYLLRISRMERKPVFCIYGRFIKRGRRGDLRFRIGFVDDELTLEVFTPTTVVYEVKEDSLEEILSILKGYLEG